MTLQKAGLLHFTWIALACAIPLRARAQGAPAPTPSPVPAPEPAIDVTEGGEGEEGGERDIPAELDALRAEIDRLREEMERAPEDAGRDSNGLKTADLARRAPGALRLGGVVTTAAVFPEDRFAQFTLPRAAVFAFAPVGDRVSFAGEVTVLGGGAEQIDADLGAPGRGDVFLQYAAVDLVAIPDLVVFRAGMIAVPMGRGNLIADESSRDLWLRNTADLYVVPTPWFDVGGGLLGGVYAGPVRIDWQAYLFGGPSQGIDSITGLRSARQPPGLDRNADKAVAGRVVVQPRDWLEFGVSGYTGGYSQRGGLRLWMGAADVAIDGGALLVEGEAVYAATDGGLGALGLPVPKSLYGGTGQLTWRFLPELLSAYLPPALQGSTIGATVRYSFADTDGDDDDRDATTTEDPNAYTRRDRLGVGLTFRPVERYVLRAEYEFRTEAGANPVGDDRAVFSATARF